MPSKRPAFEELRARGIAADAAELLLSSDTPGDKWCDVAERQPESRDAKPGWTIECVGSRVRIDALHVVTGHAVVIVLGPSGDSGVQLLEFRAVSE